MTRLSPLVILAFSAVSFPAGASVVTIGGSNAVACYEAAEARNRNLQSIQTCDRALAEEPLDAQNRAATHVNRGILRLRRGSIADAEADFDAALAINPREPEAWLNKAILNARHRKSTDALPLVAKALEYRTRRPAIAYFVRAMAYEDSGRIADAYRDLQLARRLDPKWAEPEVELRRFQVRRP